jgi:membrane associated rhomboid family serine protease
LSSERFESAARGAVPELGPPAAPPTSIAELIAAALRRAPVLSRLTVGLALIAGGVVWAIARGLSFYGPNISGAYDDLAQPPVLLIVIGVWLLFRSRRQ